MWVKRISLSDPARSVVTQIRSSQPARRVGGGFGIHLWGVDDGLVEHCRVFFNGSTNYGDRGVGIISQWSNHLLFQYNEAHHNHTKGDADEGEKGDAHRALTAEGPVTLHEVAAVYPRLEAEWLRRHGHGGRSSCGRNWDAVPCE